LTYLVNDKSTVNLWLMTFVLLFIFAKSSFEIKKENTTLQDFIFFLNDKLVGKNVKLINDHEYCEPST
jgi:hypothetical protein